jgi:hypothetical protein
MKKQKAHVFGKNVYLLGIDENGLKYFIEESKWDCGWYWSIGYVETYTNNNNPEKSKDIQSHSHFNYMFMKDDRKNCMDKMKDFFIDMTLSEKELYRLWEIMKSLYTLREYSDMLYTGGSHITTNPCNELIKNDAEYERINREVIPELLKQLYTLLSVTEEEV